MPYFRMSDGREFTSYQPTCQVVQHLQNTFNILDGHDFRYFLQNNPQKVLEELEKCNKDNDCTACPICQKKN
jgi:hypothetical protein